MKKFLIVSVLGLTLTSRSFGQGSVEMNNADNNGGAGAPVLYGPFSGGTIGTPVIGANWHNQLAYILNGTFTESPGAILPINPSLTLSSTAIGLGQGGDLPGTLTGVIISIPGYLSGPVTFEWITF